MTHSTFYMYIIKMMKIVYIGCKLPMPLWQKNINHPRYDFGLLKFVNSHYLRKNFLIHLAYVVLSKVNLKIIYFLLHLYAYVHRLQYGIRCYIFYPYILMYAIGHLILFQNYSLMFFVNVS